MVELDDTDSGGERACRGANATARANRHSSSDSNDKSTCSSNSLRMISSERRRLTQEVAEDAAKRKQLKPHGLRKSPSRKAATAAAAEARRA